MGEEAWLFWARSFMSKPQKRQRWDSNQRQQKKAPKGSAYARASSSHRSAPRCCAIPMLSASCWPEERCLFSRNSWDSLIARPSDAISATVKSKGERSQEPRRLPGKPSLHSQPGEARAHVGRREDEGEPEPFGHGKCHWRVPFPMM